MNRKSELSHCAISIISLMILFTGCKNSGTIEISDNQRNLSPEMFALVNPYLNKLDYKSINEKHQILVAVIDNGVDYNHPDLEKNIHYKLDPAQKKIIGTGWDFVAHDALPSPYLAKEDLQSNSLDYKPLVTNPVLLNYVHEFVDAEPEFSLFIDLNRNVIQEHNVQAGHGTHVAGIISQSDPRIGILPYRYLPISHRMDNQNYQKEIVQNLLAATQKAIKDGAKIINISSSIEISEKKLARIKEKMPSFEEWKKIKKRFKKIVINSPQTLFVAAAGNSKSIVFSDSKDVVNFPCGIKAPNIICVGSIDKNQEISTFSNIPANDLKTIYILGEDITSTYPTKMCGVDNLELIIQSTLDSISSGDDSVEGSARSLNSICKYSLGKHKTSGTSQAAPMLSNLAANILIDNPKFSPSEVIKTLKSISITDSVSVEIQGGEHDKKEIDIIINKIPINYSYLHSTLKK